MKYLLSLLLLTTVAHADQAQNGERLFDTRCASCHLAGDGVAPAKRAGYVDLTMLLTTHAEAQVRAWLAKPPVAKQGVQGCVSRLADRSEQDAMLAYLHKRSRPTVKEKAAPEKFRVKGPKGEQIVREKPAAKLVPIVRQMRARAVQQ